MTWKKLLLHPWGSIAAGILFFPLAKLLWIPNYMFNFLTTLVHEIGHSACAWIMGMPSIPTVSIAGGGVAVHWEDQIWQICIAILVGLGFLLWRSWKRWWLFGTFCAVTLVYIPLAFTGARFHFVTAGGVLFEIVGAGYCFWVVFAKPLERPIERPLYALIGWWMILNRGAETILMLSNRSYWESQRVIDSGLAAGMTNDLHKLQEFASLPPGLILGTALFGCIACLPAAWGAAWITRKLRNDRLDPPPDAGTI